MNLDGFSTLQSGSDIRGVAVGTAEGGSVVLTEEIVFRVAAAFAKWLAARNRVDAGHPKIGVGHDPRITSERFATCVLRGLAAQGTAPVFCGLATTPSMFMATAFPDLDFDGSVMITASHLPFYYNGLKFFTRAGGLGADDIAAILELAAASCAPDDCGSTPVSDHIEILPRYARFLRETIVSELGSSFGARPLTGIKVVLDAGNGSGGFFATQVLEPLGADLTGSCFLEPDGMFPNHIPNPENPSAMAMVCSATARSKADLGLIFDADADRMAAVLSEGTPLSRESLIAMMAAILAPDYSGGTIVTDSVTSDKLTDFLENTLGLKHRRFKRGYRNVIDEARRLNAAGVEAPLAIETSGHGAFRSNYFLDDGAYMAVRLVTVAARAKASGKTMDAWIEGFQKPFECREYRLRLYDANPAACGKAALRQLAERAPAAGCTACPTYEGVRMAFRSERAQGWFLLRTSLHEPLLVLNMEGTRPGDCDEIAALVQRLLHGLRGVQPLNEVKAVRLP